MQSGFFFFPAPATAEAFFFSSDRLKIHPKHATIKGKDQ